MNRVLCAWRPVLLLLLGMGVYNSHLLAKAPFKVKNATDANAEIVVLQPTDPVPSQAQKLNSIDINGNNPTADCTYFEIIESVKDLAKKENANIIKITHHVSKDESQDCDEVSATFYKMTDVHSAEKEISWQPGRKLKWDDFKGPVPQNADNNTAAVTYCGIGFETNKVSNTNKAKVFVYNTFYTNQSWVRGDAKNTDILAHEQGHFDLCEIYTRKLRQQIAVATLNVDNLKATLESIYAAVNKEYEDRQQAYEDETQHGTIAAQQQKWLQTIAQELIATRAYASL
jgi:hypothetical protein